MQVQICKSNFHDEISTWAWGGWEKFTPAADRDKRSSEVQIQYDEVDVEAEPIGKSGSSANNGESPCKEVRGDRTDYEFGYETARTYMDWS